MQLSHRWAAARPLFDDENLVSCAGLVPVMELAEQAGLSQLLAAKVSIATTNVASAGVNPAGKITSIVAGMAAGADCIDDLDVIRTGGMPRLFGGVYAPATMGQLLREFTHGHTRQLASVAREHLVGLAELTERHRLLREDRARVELRIHAMERDAKLLLPAADRPGDGDGSAMVRQE